jgi:cell division protein FtsW
MKKALTYLISCVFVMAVHGSMLLTVYNNGKYDSVNDVITLAAAVILLDAVYFAIMPLFRQRTYAVDFMLLLILNMSMIFQSCFGGVHFDMKHFITMIAALVSCRIGFILCRNHRWIQT